MNAAPKKRYLIGLKEVSKNLNASKVNMVIIATNIERVEGEHGLDEQLLSIRDECKRQGVPLIYAMPRSQLGFVTKY